MRLSHVAPIALVAVGCVTVAACGSSTKRNVFGDGTAADAGDQSQAGFIDGGPGQCQGLACKVASCSGGTTTTLTGKVYDPAGANPLYDVMVYIPGGPNGDAPLPDITSGVSCDQCANIVLSPMVSALTDETGSFTLNNVPVADDVPIVVQVGKWRRKTTVDIKTACQENKVDDKVLHLPKNGTEGDMPQIAVTAGGCDALECLLRGIGVDESEFVAGDDPSGHVHVFKGEGGVGVAGSPAASNLWNDSATMAPYDMVMLSCECSENTASTSAKQAMWDYANMGGRIFATHFHYTWFKNSPQPDWKALATWTDSDDPSDTYDVNQGFPKGAALAKWLVAVNASSTLGKIELTDVTGSLTGVHAPAQSWISEGANTRYFSFNAPTAADESAQCGRAVYSDLHLMGISAGGQAFPTGCPAPGGLSAQQKALEFMFFDLSSCIQSDDTPPSPPQ